MLAFLLIGTAYSEQLPNKPFKVCPEIVAAKDTPCRVLGSTVAVVHRIEKDDPRDKEIAQLKEQIKVLEDMIRLSETNRR